MNAPVAWWIARNELRRMAKDRALVIFGLALPVVIIVLVGATFGSAGTVHLGLLDQDGSARSAAVVHRLEGQAGIDLARRGSEATLRRDVRSTALDAGIVIPRGYGAAMDRGKATIDVVVDPSSPAVATALATLQSAIDEQAVTEGAVQLVAANDGGGSDGRAAARREVATAATRIDPVVVRDAPGVIHGAKVGTFSYTAPGNLVLFVFINTFAVSTLLANDRRQGLIRRLLVTPNHPRSVVAGIGAAKLSFSLVQSFLILTVGALAFGVHWGDPFAALVLTVVFATLSTAIGLIVGASVRNADQAQSIGIPFAVAMGMLGGCMWPLEIVPAPMRIAGHIVPHAWAMDAWQELIFDGAGLRAILPELAVLAGAAAVLSVVAVRLLRRSVVG
jgi:ABC-2 type transport system permease protein